MSAPEARVLGLRVDCIDMAQALHAIGELVETGQGGFVATINPEIVMHARRDPEYAQLLAAASLALPDGVGVVWALRRRGCPKAQRVTGVDLVAALAETAATRGWRVFLLGAAPGTAAQAALHLRRSEPQLQVVGTHAGSPDEQDDPVTYGLIAKARPQIMLVAYGFPKQEQWIARARQRWPELVGIGVGGAFDFIAGRVPRAPSWMQRLGLEWLFRLLAQPWRWRRMAVLPVYALEVLREERES